jgi:hypothetical protein
MTRQSEPSAQSGPPPAPRRRTLAERMPAHPAEFVGQRHLLGERLRMSCAPIA